MKSAQKLAAMPVPADTQQSTSGTDRTKVLMRELNVAIKDFFESYDESQTASQKLKIVDKIVLAAKVQNVLRDEIRRSR